MNANQATLLCPDCGQDIPAEEFVEHREREHPPAPTTLAPQGIATAERFGYQDDE